MLLALQTACTTSRSIQTYDDYNPNFDFTRYQTFSFISPNPMIVGGTARPVSPLLETQFMRAIRGALEGKGFRYLDDPERADLAISFTIDSREQIRVDQYPVSYREFRHTASTLHSRRRYQCRASKAARDHLRTPARLVPASTPL